MRFLLLSLLIPFSQGCTGKPISPLGTEASWSMQIGSCWNVMPLLGDVNGDSRDDLIVARGTCDYQAEEYWPGAIEFAVHEGLESGFATNPSCAL